jgi:hypothetical protein
LKAAAAWAECWAEWVEETELDLEWWGRKSSGGLDDIIWMLTDICEEEKNRERTVEAPLGMRKRRTSRR